MKIALQQVQQNIGEIANRHECTRDVLYELLAAYGRSKSAITQLREGHLNKAEDENAVLQKDVVYFKTFAAGTQLEHEVIKLYEDPLTQRYNPRYLIATDLTNLAAKDNLKDTTLTIKLADIDDHLDFFYGWTGDEVVDTKTEAVADRRAADKMNELYVEIEKQNRAEFVSNPKFRHELNVFFTRLLFCFFAEDTGIYEDGQFTTAIKTYTQTDGSDLAWFFGELFTSLDTEDKSELKSPFKEFPYVNGSIFNTKKHEIAIPKFSAQARHLILECGRQNWGEINPDIFGTIFQGVVDPEHRDENGMDYTSAPNIMKVIKPLFLDELHELFESDKYYNNEKKLWSLLARIHKIKIFDPACGSGNFLIIAYKELRQLQHAIIARIDQLRPAGLGTGIPDNQLININNFYGIEIDDFAHELAVLSLYLAKHQMNQEFTEQFGKPLSIIPLIDIPTIVRGNAARLDWQEVCPNVGHTVTKAEQEALFDFGEPEQAELDIDQKVYDEIYLIGNPPYKGADKQTPEQKTDFKAYFGNEEYSGNSDYISIWLIKGARYIAGTKARLAFVSVNSVCQGEHVGLMFPKIFDEGVEIGFAHTSFKWQNSARDQAGVTVIVLSLRNPSKTQQYLYSDDLRRSVDHINAYLLPSDADIVFKRNRPISHFPEMVFGSMPRDESNLVLSPEDRDKLSEDPRTEKFIKKYLGASEFIRGNDRYCLWIEASDYEEAKIIPVIKERVERVAEFRAKSKAKSTQDYASRPYRFVQISYKPTNSIIVPRVSSERREYIPMGFLDKDTVISDAANAIYDAEPWLFALLESKMHMAWIRTVCGQLETRIRYSSTLGYNTFPINPLTEAEKDALNKSARKILLARAAHPEKTLADMYDPDKMPANLREAHEENDHLVDNLYKKGGFRTDEDRLASLFDLYEQMTAKERSN
ncbi:class I SAM-dependent DNA methyltransferase [Candidatus Saccharibacteria bacterium]|nr:class I SAM-dependent DNA methyltransferase [Candidatus Saccharibacteria bacterium]